MGDEKPALSIVPSNSLRDRIARHQDERSVPLSEISRATGVGIYKLRSSMKTGKFKRADADKLEQYLADSEGEKVTLPSLVHQLDQTARLLRDKIALRAVKNDRGFGLVHNLVRRIEAGSKGGEIDGDAAAEIIKSNLSFLLDFYFSSIKDADARLEASMDVWNVVVTKKEDTK